jgi:hypothetical protein
MLRGLHLAGDEVESRNELASFSKIEVAVVVVACCGSSRGANPALIGVLSIPPKLRASRSSLTPLSLSLSRFLTRSEQNNVQCAPDHSQRAYRQHKTKNNNRQTGVGEKLKSGGEGVDLIIIFFFEIEHLNKPLAEYQSRCAVGSFVGSTGAHRCVVVPLFFEHNDAWEPPPNTSARSPQRAEGGYRTSFLVPDKSWGSFCSPSICGCWFGHLSLAAIVRIHSNIPRWHMVVQRVPAQKGDKGIVGINNKWWSHALAASPRRATTSIRENESRKSRTDV